MHCEATSTPEKPIATNDAGTISFDFDALIHNYMVPKDPAVHSRIDWEYRPRPSKTEAGDCHNFSPSLGSRKFVFVSIGIPNMDGRRLRASLSGFVGSGRDFMSHDPVRQ
jgi:hypothetical protein